MIRVFIGFDPRETVAYHVFSHSIMQHASEPVTISPIALNLFRSFYNRQQHMLASTEFSFSRFLVPYLCNYEGWAMFADCDMLARDDIAKLWAERDENYAVQVVKHDHVPIESTKFLGAVQTKYEKKNWSSVMLFNNSRCRMLTTPYVEQATGLELHQFKWLPDDSYIGDISHRWNHLVGYDTYDSDAGIVHYTTGGPYFTEYRDCDYGDEWRAARNGMTYCKQKVLDFDERKIVSG